MVTTFSEKTETSVTSVSSRSSTRAPSTASSPTTSGSPAATRLPNTTTSSTSSTGMEMASARARSAAVWSLSSFSSGTAPPTETRRLSTSLSRAATAA